MRKKILICFICLLSFASSLYAINLGAPSAKKEVSSFIRQHNNALKKHELEKFCSFYDENFISYDGFNIEDISEMFKNTSSTFKNMKYSTKSKILDVSPTWATVQMEEKSKANIRPASRYDKKGKLSGTSNYVVYLKKGNNGWKIVKDLIINEETTIKYGSTVRNKITLSSPAFVKDGESYDLSLKINKLSHNSLALGSISKEEIVFPVKNYKEKFKKISSNGSLERVVKANTKNKNEYAIASLGVSDVTLDEKQGKINIKLKGIAYIIKRINIENKTKTNDVIVEK